MKFESINRKFTEKVVEYITKGYIINTASMSGSQGETGKVDLTDGKEIIRILLDDIHETCAKVNNNFYSFSGLAIIVGRVTDDVQPNSSNTWNTAWNQHLEVLSEERFYLIGHRSNDSKWYGTREEAIAQQDKHYARSAAREIYINHEFSDAAKAAVLPFVKRQPKCKSVRLSDITSVKKIIHYSRFDNNAVSVGYKVVAKGQTFNLR